MTTDSTDSAASPSAAPGPPDPRSDLRRDPRPDRRPDRRADRGPDRRSTQHPPANARYDKLRAALADELPAAFELRRRLHEQPRRSGDEEDTTRLVVAALGAGEGIRVAETGRLVPIGGRGGGVAVGISVDGAVDGEGVGESGDGGDGDGAIGAPAIALRAELDALPVVERTGVPWTSTNGLMHACGHDVHLAALVAVCRALGRIGPPAPLYALLQPREEGSRSGAADVVASGVFERHAIGAVIAAHVQPRVADGVVAVTAGAVNAATDEFEIVVTGRGGHAGYPHVTRDPVLALCQTVVSLQQIVSRRFDPVIGAVCSVGQINAGSAPNIVPTTASARGSIRVLRDDQRAEARELVAQIVRHTAAAHGCTAEVDILPCEPVLFNDEELARRTAALLTDAGTTVESGFRSFGADDFSYYGPAARGLMLFVGTGPRDPSGAVSPDAPGLHHESFLPGDDTVARTAEALLAGYLAAVRPAGAA